MTWASALCAPSEGPSVRVLRAGPEASVVTVGGDTEPPPAVTTSARVHHTVVCELLQLMPSR